MTVVAMPPDFGELAVTIVEGSQWDPVFHHCVNGATAVTDVHIPFDPGTVAYATFRYATGGRIIAELGPAADNLDGTLTVNSAAGTIAANLPPLESILPAFPKTAKGTWDLVVYHGGDPLRAKRLLGGPVTYSRRNTERPAADS